MDERRYLLAEREEHVSQLSGRYLGLKENLLQGCQEICRNLPTQKWHSHVNPTKIVDIISLNVTCQHFLRYLAELKSTMKSTEKLVRAADRDIGNRDARAGLASISQAVENSNACMAYVIAMEGLDKKAGAQGLDLSGCGDALVKRTRVTSEHLQDVITKAIRHHFSLCSWPPPLIAPQNHQETEWNGFQDAGDEVFGNIQQLLVILISWQMASQPNISSEMALSDIEKPLLLAGKELAFEVVSWLHSHFMPGLPTARLDKPEWLFAAGLQSIKKCSPYVDLFDPCIEAHGIQKNYSMRAEFARSVFSDGLCPLLEGAYLPGMLDQGDDSFWLHYADEAMKFEDKFAIIKEDILLSSELEKDGFSKRISAARSSIEILFEKEEWTSSWLSAEANDAEYRTLAKAGHSNEWEPRIIGIDGHSIEQHDVALVNLASSYEFYPPGIAVEAVDVLLDLFKRLQYIHHIENKMKWCNRVIKAALVSLRKHFTSELSRTEQFDHLLDDIGLPRIAGALNGLHYLEHIMTEPSGILLDVYTDAPEIERFLEKESSSTSSMRRLWTNKVIRQAMQYVFSSFDTQAFSPQRDDEADGHEGPSAAVLEMRYHISSLLNAFSKHFDSVSFREAWRGMARSANEAFFQEILDANGITDDHLRKMGANLDILINAFSGLTKKPRAYFKEAREAIKLLSLETSEAALVLSKASAPSDNHLMESTKDILSPALVRSVLEKRPDRVVTA